MLKLLLKTLRSSDWSEALDFISPAFFEVVPLMAIARLVATMSRNFARREPALETHRQWQLQLASPDLFIKVSPNSGPISRGSDQENTDRGQALLSLYFKIIHHEGSCFLDLRSRSFALASDCWQWQPAAWIHTWDPIFRLAMADIYAGYYGQDPVRFEQGLKALQLEHARALFMEQFGDGSSETLVFDLHRFKTSFHKIFISCRDHGTQLHPDFFALGMLLFSLYEHAAALGVPLSPGRAYQEAMGETLL